LKEGRFLASSGSLEAPEAKRAELIAKGVRVTPRCRPRVSTSSGPACCSLGGTVACLVSGIALVQ